MLRCVLVVIALRQREEGYALYEEKPNLRRSNKGGQGGRPGDWPCPVCRASNFASRSSCFKCGQEKPPDVGNSAAAPADTPTQAKNVGHGTWSDEEYGLAGKTYTGLSAVASLGD